ncbi:hypothetical protein FGO68_gene433 [Halteria grandinella]|uniref:Cyclin-like domain-containing protein n=1 Tax=Halteria grandinella TaxID=5974 RepID=A0A8J8T256_HALGN|nr:hypothetical protein FGO68_gene433 [Halteria grandinella]
MEAPLHEPMLEADPQPESTLLGHLLQSLPAPQDRVLNIKNYLDFICDDLLQRPLYLPLNTVTPSEQNDGMGLMDERKLRVYACEIIQDSGILLKLPQVTMATAQSILHRFYFRKSFLRCDIVTVATASLFIAAKIEENPRKVRDVITVVDYVVKLKKNGGNRNAVVVIDINSFHFTDTRQEIFEAERYILKELGFATESLSRSNVHKYVYFYLNKVLLKHADGNIPLLGKTLAQKAWNIVNDCYRTTCIVSFPPNVIACSAIYLAARLVDYPFPSDPETKHWLPWWTIFGASIEDMEYVTASILEIYQPSFAQDVNPEYVERLLATLQAQNQPVVEAPVAPAVVQEPTKEQASVIKVDPKPRVRSSSRDKKVDDSRNRKPSRDRRDERRPAKREDSRDRRRDTRPKRRRSTSSSRSPSNSPRRDRRHHHSDRHRRRDDDRKRGRDNDRRYRHRDDSREERRRRDNRKHDRKRQRTPSPSSSSQSSPSKSRSRSSSLGSK